MSELNEKALQAYHLSKQLSSACYELFKEMTKETKAGNVKDLTDFDFVRNVMLVSGLVNPLAEELKSVYISLGLIAFRQPGFMEKVNEDILLARQNRETNDGVDCSCSLCKQAADDVLARAQEIVNKTNQKP